MTHSRNVKLMERAGLTAIILAAIMVVGFGLYNLYETSRWDPLGDYPVQVVTQLPSTGDVAPPTTALVAAPDNSTTSTVSFYKDQEINSSGIKCVENSEGIIQIKGTLSWVSDKPGGKIIEVAKASSERGPGCQLYTFSNPIPDVIQEELDKLSEKGIESSDWHLTGTEIPIREDGEEGVSRTWITTTFTIIHRETPR
jgi:hypothetical protein